jgi:hypothetical protein
MAQFKELSRIAYRDEDVVIIELPRTGGPCSPEDKKSGGL